MLNYNINRNIIKTIFHQLPNELNKLNISSEAYIRVVIEEIKENKKLLVSENNNYQFLNDDVWDDASTPDDLAENHDLYLYGDQDYE